MSTIRVMRHEDREAVLAIYGEGIATGHATFEETVPVFEAWDRAHLPSPRLVVEEQDAVVGFAALAPVSARTVYRGVAEVSLYVAERAQGRGLARRLLEGLIEAAEGEGIWTLQAGIFPENRGSLALHQACGFRLVGRHERIGRMSHGPMAGRWRDVLLLEKRASAARESEARPEALLFDVFGTLVDWRRSIARELETEGLPGSLDIDGDAFARAWRARYQPAMERVRQGERGFVRLDVLHRENLIETLAQFGINGLSDEAIDDLNRVWHRLDPWPDVVEGLTRLKSSYLIAPCSNGNIALMTNLAKRAGMPFDAILGAEPARAYKPTPETYLHSVDMLGLVPGECMMVAAHNDDLAAAATLGLMTAFVPRPEEYGIDQVKDLEATGSWTIVATDLVDLAGKLGC